MAAILKLVHLNLSWLLFTTYELAISSFNSIDQFNGPGDIVKRKTQTDRR